jgi:hypothetical protein
LQLLLRKFLQVGTWTIALLYLSGCNKEEASRAGGFVSHWSVKPSLVYDSCHLIGILTGRPLYSKYYPQVYRDWSWNLPAHVRNAITQIDLTVGPGWPPGPRLSMLLANFPPADSLAEILSLLRDDEHMRARLMASDYRNERNWQQWLALKPNVTTVLDYLRTNQFENYWRSKFLPELLAKIPSMKQELQAYDVVGDVERFLGGVRFERDTLELHLLSLGQPHEVRLRRQTRIVDAQLPLRPVVRNFYREMLHPYCDQIVDSLLAPEFAQLPGDDFLQACLQKFDFYGTPLDFNTFCRKELVFAAELWLAGRRQLLDSPQNAGIDHSGLTIRSYFRDQGNDAHGLAVVIYSYLEAGLKPDRISYADFVKDLFASGKLRAGKIAGRYHEFFSSPGLAQ